MKHPQRLLQYDYLLPKDIGDMVEGILQTRLPTILGSIVYVKMKGFH